MADGVFNIAKGRVNEYVNRVDSNDPANAVLIVLLLKVSVADAVMEDFDDLAAIIADAGNTEADFTNYVRFTLVDTDVTNPTPDDTNNRQDANIPDQTWTAAGGAADNTLTKMLVCFDSDSTGGTDANIIPLTFHDFAITTNGNDLTAVINASGFFRAS